MTDEYLWPARNVAEYAYCPRLFYLMEVEGVHVPSADTVQGIAVHRRVDKPGNAPPDLESTDGDRPLTVRSLTLAAASDRRAGDMTHRRRRDERKLEKGLNSTEGGTILASSSRKTSIPRNVSSLSQGLAPWVDLDDLI